MDRELKWEVSSPISHLLTSGWVLSQFKWTYHSCPLFAQLLQADKSGGLIGDRCSIVVTEKAATPVQLLTLCCIWRDSLNCGVIWPKVYPPHMLLTRSGLKWVSFAPPSMGNIRDWRFFKGLHDYNVFCCNTCLLSS